MKETRVDKYASYREEIKNTHSNKVVLEEKEENIALDETRPLDFSLDEAIKKHDEYTIMLDSAKMAEKKSEEDRRKRAERKHKILNSITYGVIAIIVIALIIVIVYLLGGDV